MLLPLQITFRNFPHSSSVEAAVRERAAKLDRYHRHIVSCRVAIEMHHQQRARNKLYTVRIDVKVPHEEIVVDHEATGQGHGHEDVHVAVNHAFDAMKRRLQSAASLSRGEAKLHESAPAGRVLRIFPQEQYGFIVTVDGREIYFHENAVLNGAWQRLAVGDEVRFAEEDGENGPQASTVVLVASPRRAAA